MSDINSLEWLAGQLRQGATTFSNAAQTLRQQAQRLDWSVQDLTSNVNAWAGTGSDNFKTAWQNYHSNTQKSATALDNTSQALTKLAQKIEDSAQQMQAAQAMQEASGWLTFGLGVLDVVQLGLDPVTDAATVGAVGADVTAEAAMTAAEDAIVEADLAGAGELGGIGDAIEGVSDSGEIGLDGGGTPDDFGFDNEPFGEGNTGASGGSGGGGPTDDDPVRTLLPRNRYPQTASHVDDAVNNGQPSVLHIARDLADDNRSDSLAGYPTRPGFDRDEYPMAFTREGGRGADIRYINPSDNRGAGSFIAKQLLDYPDGTPFIIQIIDEWLL